MNTAKRNKIILSVLIILIIAAIMYSVSIRPSVNEVKDLNGKISSARESIDNLKGKSALINELKKQLEEVEAQVKDTEGNMADFDDYALYLSDFQDITDGRATETKINFLSVAPSASGHYTLVQTSIKFVCGYDDLKYIMSALLEKNVNCYDVSITVASSAIDSDTDETKLSVSFTADYFSRSGVFTPTDYDFTSGRYGLSALFDGVVIGSVNDDAGTTEEPANP